MDGRIRVATRPYSCYEQRFILQPIYENTYSARQADGGLYQNQSKFRQAILNGSRWWMPEATVTNVVGTDRRFTGADLGDADQRMVFVNQIADTFMARYNQPNGHTQILNFYRKELGINYGRGR